VETLPTNAKSVDGRYIAWEESLIDIRENRGVKIAGAGRIEIGDLNRDGSIDVVSAHKYSSHIRIAWGMDEASEWSRHYLAEGHDVDGVSDLALADFSGDGWPDIAAACANGRLLYLENPRQSKPGFIWKRTVIEASRRDAGWSRLAAADFDGDGRPEIVGTADDGLVAAFQFDQHPLDGPGWRMNIIGTHWPFDRYHEYSLANTEPADLDSDGDIDLLLTFDEGPARILWNDRGEWTEQRFRVYGLQDVAVHEAGGERILRVGGSPGGSAVQFFDFSGDGRLDILAAQAEDYNISCLRSWRSMDLFWYEQPSTPEDPWKQHRIGAFEFDPAESLAIGDIDGDARTDVAVGTRNEWFGLDPRLGRRIGPSAPRIAWFQNMASGAWSKHDILRREQGAFWGLATRDIDGDGNIDLVAAHGDAEASNGVFTLRQMRTDRPARRLRAATLRENVPIALPESER